MRNLSTVPLVVLLTACATTTSSTNQSNQQSLSQWEGKSITGVVKKLGTPNQSFVTATGGSYFVYTTKNYQEYPSGGYAPGYANLSRAGAGTMVPISETKIPDYSMLKCALIFKTDSQKMITSIDTKGYNCYSTITYLNR